MNPSPIRFVIFDCDGTLVDSEFICNDALRMQLAASDIHENTDQLLTRYQGRKLQDIIDDLQARHRIRFDEDFVIDYRKKVESMFATDLRPVSGIIEALSNIHLPICVASSGPVAKIRHALQITGLLEFFEGRIFSSYEVGSWKPEPDLFAFAARSIGAAPVECAVIEDSELGIIAANRAGMQPFWYRPESLSKPAAEYAGTVVFSEMAMLPRLLRRPKLARSSHSFN